MNKKHRLSKTRETIGMLVIVAMNVLVAICGLAFWFWIISTIIGKR